MGMGGGSTGGAVSDINVTPLIDVLLVLLIIFMVIVPVVPKGLDALVPQPPKNKSNDDVVNSRTIVVQVLNTANNPSAPTYKINEDAFPKDQLVPQLTSIFAARNEKVMFVKGDPDIDFGKIAEVISFGKSAAVDNVGIITPKIQAGQ